ncbi:PadR family transcriptional regulator [Neobacillus kokaensis]|uniref:Negative transcription regulator PadR n=1 Tax=Neobacillus kokaensis TaxID=2759023 RepID=A0ABQ3N5S3_9BACI|nr:PadR family transcriptional regulator [Neobacillus kokaensis]GHI00030.1 negative transcription regulator PadR [Neobacillus kokaensis]
MNTLGYAILSALGRKSYSGYELGKYLENVWPAKHSQIYPMLTKMEEKGFLVHEIVEQVGRPNKKIYSITEKGTEALKKWIAKSPSEQIHRDEFLIKVYSSWLLGEENSAKLVHDRIAKLDESIASLSDKITEMEQMEELETTSKDFGRYLLFSRKFRLAKEEKDWCQWVLGLLKNKKVNFTVFCLAFTGRFNLLLDGLPWIALI